MIEKLIKEIEQVENMYLDKKHILKRLKQISKERHELETNKRTTKTQDTAITSC